MVGTGTPASLWVSWNWRTSSVVALSDGRRRKLAKRPSSRMYLRRVATEKWRMFMSSISFWRSGLTGTLGRVVVIVRLLG